jgi:hypothetical protein
VGGSAFGERCGGSAVSAQVRLESGEANALVAAKRERPDQALFELAALLASAQERGWALVALDCAG